MSKLGQIIRDEGRRWQGLARGPRIMMWVIWEPILSPTGSEGLFVSKSNLTFLRTLPRISVERAPSQSRRSYAIGKDLSDC
jgi:hypothetical protein